MFVKKKEGSVMGEDSLLERVTAAAEERQLSQNSLIAYRRTWLKIIAWAAAEGLVLETFPVERVGEFYEEATRGRSASDHLQVKAALAASTFSGEDQMVFQRTMAAIVRLRPEAR